MIGGYFGENSYATSFPNEGDVYLETVYRIQDDGTFGEPIDLSRGLLIRRDEYTHIEIFGIPKQIQADKKPREKSTSQNGA
jgi:hypothetical protein